MKATIPLVTIRYKPIDLVLWPLTDQEGLILALIVVLPWFGFYLGWLAGRT